ncbi:hypothetical protein MASR1M74_12250 [Lentimicrobium sp.]
MSPDVAIALITKLKLIFETDALGRQKPDKFLAFQNGAFPVSKENFHFIEPDKYQLSPIDTALKMMDFSKNFNFITSVDDFISPTDYELEEIYHETLKEAIGANSHRTADEEKRYNAAKRFLNEIIQTSDGQNITRLANYNYYDNLHKEALSEFKNRELAAASAQGENAARIKLDWQKDMPVLKKAIDLCLLNFETLGQRSEVDKHYGELLTLAGKAPVKTIADFKTEYELFAKTSTVDHLANELQYIPTYFTPINFFDENVRWQEMSIDKSEINALMQQASDRLKVLFNTNNTNQAINHISFEYTVVSILRPWLHYKDFLLQGFWKFDDNSKILSDGEGNGLLPAFPEKMIFVRNLRIEKPEQKPEKSGSFWEQLFQKLKPNIAETQLRRTAIIDDRKIKSGKLIMTMLEQEKPVLSAFTSKTVLNKTGSTRLKKNLSKAASLPLYAKPAEVDTNALLATIQPTLYKAGTRLDFEKDLNPQVEFNRLHTKSLLKKTRTKITEQKEMELLAFLCRIVPPCPSPDSQFKWDE